MNLLDPSAAAAFFSAEFCLRLTQSLLHFLWQGLAIGLVVWLIDWLLPRASSRFLYAVGVAALLFMLACIPGTYFAMGYLSSGVNASASFGAVRIAAPPESSIAGDSADRPADIEARTANFHPVAEVNMAASDRQPHESPTSHSLTAALAPYATVAYLLGVVIMLGRLTLALASGHSLRSSATPLSDPAILAMAARQAKRIGLKVVPAVAWCQRAAVPLVVGIVKPVVLLPTAIASGLSPDQLESLLAHELAHLKRLDLLVNLVQRLAESLLFFHPAVWYVSRRISTERENCCDDCVLAAGWGRAEYADALVRMAEVCAAGRALTSLEGAALLAASGEGPSQFKRRVLRLLDSQDHLRMGISRGWLLATVGAVLLTIAAVPFAASWKHSANAAQRRAAKEQSEAVVPVTTPNQPAEKPENSRPKEKRYFRGQSALDRIDEVDPAWSETQEGVQLGVALLGDKTQFGAGERVPLELFVRNVGIEGVDITLSAEFLGNVPEVKNAAGEAIQIERILLTGSVALYRELLKPGEAFGFRHLGVGLGPNPAPGKQNWHPYVAEPQPGKYTLRHTHEIEVDPESGLVPGKRVKFTSGAVAFEILDGAAGGPPSRGDQNRALQAAQLERQEFLTRKFPNDERLLKDEVVAAEQALSKSQESFASAKRLAAKGLITAIQLEPAELAVRRAEGELQLAQGKLDVLRKLTKEKTLRELDQKVVAALKALLDQRVALKVTDRPLIFVLDDLEKAHEIPVTIDLKEVHARGLSAQTRVTIDVTDKPLREVFKAVLSAAGLNFEVTENGIHVPAKAKPPADDAAKGAGPAQIHVKYDIAGAEEDGQIFVQHIGGRDIIGVGDGKGQLPTNPVKKGQTLELDKLDPGDYQVARHRVIRLEGVGMSRFLDRQRFKLAAGEIKAIDFTRPKGQPVTGTVSGLKEAGLKTAVVNICSEDAKDDQSVTDLDVTLFDSRLCAADGTFTTERLAPGRYKIIVEGYVITPERLQLSGIIRPSYLAITTVTVPAEGEAPKVEVKLEDAEKAREAAKAGARLEIRYDIPGAEERGRFVVEGPNGSIGPEKIGMLFVNYVNRGQSLKLENLPAGKYQVTRYRTLRMEAAFGTSRLLDRRQFELKGGDAKTLEFTRPAGKRVSGKIVGLEGKGINKVLVNVCDASADGRESLSKLETTIYDALLAKDDGSFTTEPLPPGEYTIVAEAYLPLTPEERVRSGVIRPRYVGVAKLTVPETGEPAAVEIQLQEAKRNADGAAKRAQQWGNLSVQFVYDGPRPEPKKIAVTRDVAVFGEAVDESLLVGDKGELANVAVYVTSADVPVHPEARKTTEGPAVLKVADGRTQPRILPFAVSQQLRLINDTVVGVSFKWEGQANSPFNVLVRANGAWESSLKEAERMPTPLTDSIHPWLIGYLLPLDHPYAAVSDTGGVARLANLPAGEWTFRLWHEKGGYLKSPESGERQFKVKIEPGENRLKLRVSPEFAVTIEAAADAKSGPLLK